MFGGVAGWKYFNGAPGGEREPWKWAEFMTRVLRPGEVPRLGITRAVVEGLERAWMVSAAAAGDGAANATAERWGMRPDVDYMAMVNE